MRDFIEEYSTIKPTTADEIIFFPNETSQDSIQTVRCVRYKDYFILMRCAYKFGHPLSDISNEIDLSETME